MTIKEALKVGAKKLHNLETSYLDTEILLSYTIKKNRTHLFAYPKQKLTKQQEYNYKKLINRRAKHEPIAYIIGYKEFYGFKFKVNKNVLIPRPDTETLINLIKNPKNIIDIGTGSGAIAITLKKLFPKIQVLGTEINPQAIKIAKENANKLKAKIKIKKGNLLIPFKKTFQKYSYNLTITANLPYLSINEWQKLEPNIKLYEPKNALIGGKTGLELYEKLLREIKYLITPLDNYYIKILIEIGYKQKTKAITYLKYYLNPKKIKTHKDLSKRWRVISAELKK